MVTITTTKYRELKKKASAYEAIFKLPHYQLKGRAAQKLDHRVDQALKEHCAGKTKKINSLADLM